MTGSIGPVKLSISNFIIILVVLIVAVGLIYSLLGWAIAGWQRKVKEPNGAIQNAVSNRQSRLTDCDLTGQMIASSDIVRSRSWGVLGGSRIRRRVNLSGKTDDEQPEAIELQVV